MSRSARSTGRWPALRAQARSDPKRLVRQRVGPHLEPEDRRHAFRPAFGVERGPAPRRRPDSPPLPAGVGVVDTAVEALARRSRNRLRPGSSAPGTGEPARRRCCSPPAAAPCRPTSRPARRRRSSVIAAAAVRVLVAVRVVSGGIRTAPGHVLGGRRTAAGPTRVATRSAATPEGRDARVAE